MHSGECGLCDVRLRRSVSDMAIAFARARYISRSTGGSVTRSAAYNAREAITDERIGESYSFAHRDAPEHHAVLLPEGADPSLSDSSVLWNAAEKAERRCDAQVARELVIALPANAELTHEDRVAMVTVFAQEHFVSKGLAVQLDVHAPHEGGEESETANHHAHLLVTTRRIEGDRLSAKKARDLDPEVRRIAGRSAVTEGEAWGELWRDHQNTWFEGMGLAIRVDATDAVPQEHVGPIRMRTPESAAVLRAEQIAEANAQAVRYPDKVLAALTRNNATFNERDLDRHISRHVHDETEHLAIKARVLGSPETLALHDPDSGDRIGRYTSRDVREEERAALADAQAVGRRSHRALAERHRGAALDGRSLRDDQRAAFDHATAAGGLKIIEGRAGTGKSYTLQAVRDAHERAGYRVIALAPTNSVAQDLKADGFSESGTVHAELFALKNGRTQWTAKTLIVVDEAAMLDTGVTSALMREARSSGAKLVLAGDDRQLASIERGGLFAELRERHGSAKITEVTRQQVDWQRQAAREMSEGRTLEALSAFARNGALDWSATLGDARARLVSAWSADSLDRPSASRFVFAYTNADVDALNADLRQVRKARGELGEGVAFQTKHGPAEFAVGDRVQFTDTIKRDGIFNGAVATITGIDGGGRITAALDRPVGAQASVSWDANQFDGFRHGYAGTIYKGQGKTLDHTYLYHSHHWRQAASYVALTRQRESATIFAATETAADLGVLARQMSRTEVRAASVAWATADELPPALRERAQAASEPMTSKVTPSALKPAARAGSSSPRSVLPQWLIAPRESAPPDPAERAAAVASDADVRRERVALDRYLVGAFVDPNVARARLDALVEHDGPTSAARRIAADPAQLGVLHGRTGLLAGRAARAERSRAERVAEAVAPAMTRIADAQAGAGSRYDQRVGAERAAEAVGVPRLSKAAARAVAGLAGAPDAAVCAERWKAVVGAPKLEAEIGRFMVAVERRFGSDAILAMDRGEAIQAPRIGSVERERFVEVSKIVRAVLPAEREAAHLAQRLAATQHVGLGRKLKP